MKKKLISIILIVVLIMIIFSFVSCSNVIKLAKDMSDSEQQEQTIDEYIKNEKYDETFKEIKEYMGSNHIDPSYLNKTACTLLNKGKTEEALFILSNLVEDYSKLNNKVKDATLNNLGWTYYALGKYNLADYYAERALEISPNEAIEYVNKANALWALKKIDEAKEFYNKAIDIDKECTEAIWGIAMCAFEKEDYDNSLKFLKKYIKLKPNDEESTRYYIATSYIKLNMKDKAIEEYNKHYFSKPEDTNPLYSIISIYIDNEKENDYEKALEYCEEIISVNKDDSWAYLYKARCLAALNRKDEACENLKKAFELNEECMYELSYYNEFKTLRDFSGYKRLFM